VHTIEPPEGLTGCDGVRWSPDGTMLVHQERESVIASHDLGSLFVYDLGSGESTRLIDLGKVAGLDGREGAWWWWVATSFSPDGRSVIFHLPRGPDKATEWDAWSAPVSGGEPTLVLKDATFPFYLPERRGDRVPRAEPVGLRPVRRGRERRRLRHPQDPGGRGQRDLVAAISPDGTRIVYSDAVGSIWSRSRRARPGTWSRVEVEPPTGSTTTP